MKKNQVFAMMILAAMLIVAVFTMPSCAFETEADNVNQNISKEADNFNILRRISVINMRSDAPLFELAGYFSMSNNINNELVVTVEVGDGVYKKHYIYLNDWTMYVVEDLSGAMVSPYYYEISFLPEGIQPFGITGDDYKVETVDN